MFLHVFVILFTGGSAFWGGRPPPPRPGRQTSPQQTREADPPPPADTPGYGQSAVGIHLTEMHSCLLTFA